MLITVQTVIRAFAASWRRVTSSAKLTSGSALRSVGGSCHPEALYQPAHLLGLGLAYEIAVLLLGEVGEIGPRTIPRFSPPSAPATGSGNGFHTKNLNQGHGSAGTVDSPTCVNQRNYNPPPRNMATRW